MKDIKVLRVIPSMNPVVGGPAQGLRNLIPYLERLGVNNTILTVDPPTSFYLEEEPLKVVPVGSTPNSWSYSADLAPWLDKHLCQFDAVIVHGLWLFPGFATFKAIKRIRARGGNPPKLFVVPHGMLDPYFQNTKSRRLKAIRNWFYWIFIEKKIINSADAILFTCEEEKQIAGAGFPGYHPKILVNVGYGIPDPIKGSRRTILDGGSNDYILFMSRIHQKKGLDILINVYADLVKGGVDLPRLVIAGPAEGTFGQMIGSLIEQSPLGTDGFPLISYIGMIQGDEKWRAISRCKAFILPSHQENFGIAIVEALACGKPVLISDKVNIWREIISADAGLVSSDDEEGVQTLLTGLVVMDNNQLTKMGINARRCYEENFTESAAAEKWAAAISA